MKDEVNVEDSVAEAYKCGSALVMLDKDYNEKEPIAVTEEKIRYARTIAKQVEL